MLKETHLKMEDTLLDFGWKMGATHLEPVSLTVPSLPELTQWYISCVSPANALVIVLALNSKYRVVVLASAKETIPNVGEYCMLGLLLLYSYCKNVEREIHATGP